MASIPHCGSFALTGTCDERENCQLPHISVNVLCALDSAQRRSQAQSGVSDIQEQLHDSTEEQQSGILDEVIKDSGFIYDPTLSMTDEFYRMCDTFGWRGCRDGGDGARTLFKRILALQLTKANNENMEDRHETPEDAMEEILGRFAALTTHSIPVTTADKKEVDETSSIHETKEVAEVASPLKSQTKKLPSHRSPKSPTRTMNISQTNKPLNHPPLKSSTSGGNISQTKKPPSSPRPKNPNRIENNPPLESQTRNSPSRPPPKSPTRADNAHNRKVRKEATSTNGGPPYDNSINMDREKLGYLWARSYDA